VMILGRTRAAHCGLELRRVTAPISPGPSGRLPLGIHWLRERYCRVDLRWLGVFRVLLGLLLCVDLLRRWAVATDFYTNDGVLPNHFSLFRPMGRDVFSIYHAFSTLPEVSVAFALTLVVFVVFALGYRTRLFHALSLICITSLNARNLLVENGGTVVVNLICFWTLFLPLGRRFSLDALLASLKRRQEHTSDDLNARPAESEEGQVHYSLVMFALLLQWSGIYFFNVVHKSGAGWENGTALHWFLHQDRIVTWFGIFAREHAPLWLLKVFTYATLVVEAALSIVLLVPFSQVWCRRLALVLALGLHGGIAATSRLGPFSYAMTLFFLIPLGPGDWAAVRRWFAPRRAPLTVIYDSDCGICFQICRVLSRLDLYGRLRFIGNDERDRIEADLPAELLARTVVVIDGAGRRFERERAVSAVLGALPLWSFGAGVLLRVPGLAWLARVAYDRFAQNRHRISEWLGFGSCGVRPREASVLAAAPDSGERGWLRLPQWWWTLARESAIVVAIVMMVIQLLVNNESARRRLPSWVRQPVALATIVDRLRLYQGWTMFAPEPPYEDGRMVVDGRTQDGRKIDPLTGAEPDFDPDTRVGWGHSQLWCDYHLKMYFAKFAGHRQHLKDYLQNWHLRTGRPEDRLVAFEVWWVNDKSPQPGALHGEPQKPVQLVSFGRVSDSGAQPWLAKQEKGARAP
jgi:predicted DCC family thiol-disulfide oxidoreductase YuxK